MLVIYPEETFVALTHIVKDEKDDLFTDTYSIFSHILNVLYMGLMMLGREKYIKQRL
jgi:hypothetical protein